MKYVLILVIKFYWWLIPEVDRRRCIYHVSCSKQIYEITMTKGFWKGLVELKNRYLTCRPGYEIINLKIEKTILIKLASGEILQEKEISENIINDFKCSNYL